MNKERLIALILIAMLAALARLLPHPDNVTPVAALALFGGAHFERKWMAFAVPMLAMLISDMVIGLYSQLWVTYLGFAAVTGVGLLLRNRKNALRIGLAAVTGSVLFFLITNFALWSGHDMYPHTFEGIIQSYALGLPFFRNTLYGDLFYSALLFGGFALAERRFSPLRIQKRAAA